MKAMYDDWCPRCAKPIFRGHDIVLNRYGYIHPECANGADDA